MAATSMAAQFACVLLAFAGAAQAAERSVAPDTSLQQAINEAVPGDRLRLLPGKHRGPVLINKPLELGGQERAEIEGDGKGTVITVTADNVTVRNVVVSGSGSSHEQLDSGIKVTKGVRYARIVDNALNGNLYGIDIHGGIDTLVRGNLIVGRQDRHMNSRGNGIYVWNAPGTVVANNDVRYGRDGIFVNTSRKDRFENNRFRNLRFAIHFMYTHDSEVIGNDSAGNHAGFAVMYSKRLAIENNSSTGDRDHGLMLNYVNDAEVRDNRITDGGQKCLFLYNSHRNRIAHNRFQGCPIGIHFTAGSERNEIFENDFVANRNQVKYVGSRWLEWSKDGRGNYWSDHAAFDLDGDNLADMPYRPNDQIDQILWSQPSARLLLGSPAIQLIRWTLSAFPNFLPGGVVDSHPLMKAELSRAEPGAAP
jgi:nitrous oxidase accessory protein